MRVYVPALCDELDAQSPTVRPGWTAKIPTGTHPEQAEVYEDDAVTEAALDSLSLLRDEEPPTTVRRAPRRLVLAVDVDADKITAIAETACDEDGVVFGVDLAGFTWSHVAAIMVDDADAEDAVLTVVHATTQDEADDAISDLWDYAIGWFDICERHQLAAALSA